MTQVDGGTSLEVPVLWADPASGASGIEPAGIWAGQAGDRGFDIDLQGIQAQGAGPAWTAASAMAAAVATLYSGQEPADVDVRFAVTGPIDGPSAGGILTVGVLAALQGDPLMPGVTMTGTVSPDGSIGAVGGVGQKLQSAADAGYTTVLLPPSSMTLTVRGTGEQISAADYGRGLGLEVRAVPTVMEAYEAFTGVPFLPGASGDVYVLPAAVADVGALTAESLVGEAEAALAFMPAGAAERAIAEESAASARSALQAGDPARAYGDAVDAVLIAYRARTVEKYRALLDTQGVAVTQESLAQEVQDALARARDIVTTSSDVVGLGAEQVMSMPSALTWSVSAIGSLEGLVPMLQSQLSREEVLDAAAVLADQVIAVDILQADALDVVASMPSSRLMPVQDVATFLSYYTEFLSRAGRANEDYLREVMSAHTGGAGRDDVNSLLPAIEVLAGISASFDPEPEEVAVEIAESAFAMTYFVTSSSAVAAGQAFGMDGFGLGEEVSGVLDEESIVEAVAISSESVDYLADKAAESGLDVGYSVWSTQWGVAAFEDLTGQGRLGSGAVLALSESWYDIITLQMLVALGDAS